MVVQIVKATSFDNPVTLTADAGAKVDAGTGPLRLVASAAKPVRLATPAAATPAKKPAPKKKAAKRPAAKKAALKR